MTQDQEQDKDLQTLYEIAKKHLGHKLFDSLGFTTEFGITISELNSRLQFTPYFKKTPCKLLHWTSLSVLFSIINEKSLRLYNLDSSEDEDELKYAGKLLGVNDNHMTNAKKNFFSMSFCEESELQNEYMWKNYGGKYQKVVIEFEVVNNSASWNNFMISPIFYHPPKQLISFLKEVDERITKFNNSFYMDMSRVIGFHKKESFNHENELRIATYFPIKDLAIDGIHIYPEPRMKTKKTDKNKVVNYIKFPLMVDYSNLKHNSYYSFAGKYYKNEKEFFEDKPKIKISNVYFGENCGLSSLEMKRFIRQIERTVLNAHGYRIDLSKDKIKKPNR
ncbi:MAG: DUF2971 domain-containing protein [Bacteroidales bacterium]|nr:DUF2971 domain-containing protein [Bacteroidales bacterium]